MYPPFCSPLILGTTLSHSYSVLEKLLLTIEHMPENISGAGNTKTNQSDPFLVKLPISLGEVDSKQ